VITRVHRTYEQGGNLVEDINRFARSFALVFCRRHRDILMVFVMGDQSWVNGDGMFGCGGAPLLKMQALATIEGEEGTTNS